MDVKDIAALLDQYPEVKTHLKKILDIIESPKNGQLSKADDVEEQTIEAVRGIGQATISSWAEQQSLQTSKQIEESVASAKKNVKKSLLGNDVRTRRNNGADVLSETRRLVTKSIFIMLGSTFSRLLIATSEKNNGFWCRYGILPSK